MINFNEKFPDAVDKIRRMNMVHQFQAIRNGVEKSLNRDQFAREYKTIHIDCGRQVGKTAYIRNNATELDLVICPNEAMKKHFLQNVMPNGKYNVWSVNQLEYCRGQFYQFRDVYIDEPGNFIKLALYDFHRNIHVFNQVVMLGSAQFY